MSELLWGTSDKRPDSFSVLSQSPKKNPSVEKTSTEGFEWRGQDLNLRPRGYEPRELPDCSTPRHVQSKYNGFRSGSRARLMRFPRLALEHTSSRRPVSAESPAKTRAGHAPHSFLERDRFSPPSPSERTPSSESLFRLPGEIPTRAHSSGQIGRFLVCLLPRHSRNTERSQKVAPPGEPPRVQSRE